MNDEEWRRPPACAWSTPAPHATHAARRRAGSCNEFLGDYVYAIATRSYGAGVWTDTRRTEDCPAFDAWRQQSSDAGHVVLPAPWPLGDCGAGFGNNDIFSATTG